MKLSIGSATGSTGTKAGGTGSGAQAKKPGDLGTRTSALSGAAKPDSNKVKALFTAGGDSTDFIAGGKAGFVPAKGSTAKAAAAMFPKPSTMFAGLEKRPVEESEQMEELVGQLAHELGSDLRGKKRMGEKREDDEREDRSKFGLVRKPSPSKELAPRYIKNLLSAANLREAEMEIIREKQMIKEMKAEAAQRDGEGTAETVETYVTGGYKQRLEERQAAAKKLAEREQHRQITQGDISRRLLLQEFAERGLEPAEVAVEKPGVSVSKTPSEIQAEQILREPKEIPWGRDTFSEDAESTSEITPTPGTPPPIQPLKRRHPLWEIGEEVREGTVAKAPPRTIRKMEAKTEGQPRLAGVQKPPISEAPAAVGALKGSTTKPVLFVPESTAESRAEKLAAAKARMMARKSEKRA